MRDEAPGGHAFFLHRRHVRFCDATLFALGDEGSERGVVLGSLHSKRMLRGDCHIGRAHQGIRPGGVDLEHARRCQIRKMHLAAEALADPITLHGFHLLRPAVKLVQPRQQLFGVGGDAHEIHGDVALFHQRAGTPAASVDHLLVGKHGLIHRVPINGRGLLIDQTFFKQLGE